jgi:hypothetical protein
VHVFFRDGSSTARVQVDFPIGRCRRAEGRPVLVKKFESAVDAQFAPEQAAAIKALFARSQQLDALPVNELMAVMVTNGPDASAAPAWSCVDAEEAGQRPLGGCPACWECDFPLAADYPTLTGTNRRVSPRWMSSAMCPLDFSTAPRS